MERVEQGTKRILGYFGEGDQKIGRKITFKDLGNWSWEGTTNKRNFWLIRPRRLNWPLKTREGY